MAVAIVDINMLGAGHDAATMFAVVLQVGEGMQMVCLVKLLQALGIGSLVHGSYLLVVNMSLGSGRPTLKCYGRFITSRV